MRGVCARKQLILMTCPDRQVACGGRHTCALTASSRVYAWGSNLQGQCGAAAAPAHDAASGAAASTLSIPGGWSHT